VCIRPGGAGHTKNSLKAQPKGVLPFQKLQMPANPPNINVEVRVACTMKIVNWPATGLAVVNAIPLPRRSNVETEKPSALTKTQRWKPAAPQTLWPASTMDVLIRQYRQIVVAVARWGLLTPAALPRKEALAALQANQLAPTVEMEKLTLVMARNVT
jgi:hypothetical protein